MTPAEAAAQLRRMANTLPDVAADAVDAGLDIIREEADWLEFGTKLMLPRDVPGHAELRAGPDAEALIEARLTEFFNV